MWVVDSAGIESERGIRETGIDCASYRISAAASAGVDLLPLPLLAIEVSIKLVSPPAGDWKERIISCSPMRSPCGFCLISSAVIPFPFPVFQDFAHRRSRRQEKESEQGGGRLAQCQPAIDSRPLKRHMMDWAMEMHQSLWTLFA